MKKTLSVILVCIVRLFAADTLVFHYDFSSLTLIPHDGYTGLEMDGALRYYRPGLPVVPVVPVRVALPAGCNDVSIEAVVSGTVEYACATPEMGSAVVPQGGPAIAPTAAVDDPYPATSVELVSIQTQRGVRVALINLFPVALWRTAGRVTAAQGLELKVTAKARSGKPLARVLAGGLCNSTDSIPYVIITSDSIRNATASPNLDSLLVRRALQGLRDTLITVEAIYAAYSGIDRAQQIRNFVIDARLNWKTDFVLLAGDTAIVPSRYFMPNGYHADSSAVDASHIISDVYYSNLDGEFNNDNDTCWGEAVDGEGGGEVDLFPDVSVGRLCGHTAAALSNQIYKILAYERTPGDTGFMNRALFAGESLGFGGVSQYAGPSLEEIRLGADQPYATLGFAAAPNVLCRTLYESDGVRWIVSAPILRIRQDSFSVYQHYGHAFPRKVMKIDSLAAVSSLNNKKCFPFLYSEGCEAGIFDYSHNNVHTPCISEILTTGIRGGFFAAITNSRVAYAASNSTDGATHRYARRFWNAYFRDSVSNLGAMLAKARSDNAWDISSWTVRHCYFTLNLFGDPYTRIRLRGENDGVPSEKAQLVRATGLGAAISPNPMRDNAVFSLTGVNPAFSVRLELFDVKGQRVLSAVRPAGAEPRILSRMEKIPQGVYLVRIRNGNEVLNLKAALCR